MMSVQSSSPTPVPVHDSVDTYEQEIQQNSGKGLIGFFVRHPIAANALMIVMLLSGLFALTKLNVQFFPTFAIDVITVQTTWPGASAEDVEKSVTTILEQELESVDNVKKMTSTSALGVSAIVLEFEKGTDMIFALDQTRQQVSRATNLPTEAEEPTVQKAARFEQIANIELVGEKQSLRELRQLADQYKQELLDTGITKVLINGLPEMVQRIKVDLLALESHDLTLADIANQLGARSLDLPAGALGENDGIRNVRVLERKVNDYELAMMAIKDGAGNDILLADVATIETAWINTSNTFRVDGLPAIQLELKRGENEHTLKMAELMQTWVAETRPTLPDGVRLDVHDERWVMVNERISLLLWNGLGGLVIVILVLYIFLSGRVAFWVAVGIPVSFMAGLFILLVLGGSINMISLFALIMALGIVVDDAIVVGENALAHREDGDEPLQAAEGGARRMFVPVVAAVLTTIATFAPLMAVPGIIGNILFDIPSVLIVVLLGAIIECFYVLPEHLKGALKRVKVGEQTGIRLQLESAFNRFRDQSFRPVVVWVLAHRSLSIAGAFFFMALAVGLLAGGRVQFVFFPDPPGRIIQASVLFESATPVHEINAYLDTMQHALNEVEQASGETVTVYQLLEQYNRGAKRGGRFIVELTSPETRTLTNQQLIHQWQKRLPKTAGVISVRIAERKGGPPGQDIQIRLVGGDANTLKQAALELQESVKSVKGVLNVEDDLPYGRDSLVMELTALGRQLGFTPRNVASQMGQLANGVKAYTMTDAVGSVEVRVELEQQLLDRLSLLDEVKVRSSQGQWIPLDQVVSWRSVKGFDALRHEGGELSVQVYADVDLAVNNPTEILTALEADVLPTLVSRYGVNYSLEGRAKDQKETMQGMASGAVIGLLAMYLILALVFGSWGWPLVVMMAIPFGLIGAILGHYWMGLNMTILSFFGFFALSGIVVNNSIILATFYKHMKESGMAAQEALLEASVMRLRPVLLTSLTTIGGLLPLLFETSFQAQFLIPMAATISFGLMFSTFLVLLIIPALLSIYEQYLGKRSGSVENPNPI